MERFAEANADEPALRQMNDKSSAADSPREAD
jgi:hypothetical protein